MSIVAVLTLRGDRFAIGRAVAATRVCRVEFERLVPTGGATIPLFWVIGDGQQSFRDALLASGDENVTVLEVFEDRTLYRAGRDLTAHRFVRVIENSDGALLEATGDADTWKFRLRFPSNRHLSKFHERCREAGLDPRLERLNESDNLEGSPPDDLTGAQRELLELAYEEGYFEIPRGATLVALAEMLGVSDQAVSERMRRGLDTLVERTVASPFE